MNTDNLAIYEINSELLSVNKSTDKRQKKCKFSKSKSYDLIRMEIYIEHKIFYQLKHDQD